MKKRFFFGTCMFLFLGFSSLALAGFDPLGDFDPKAGKNNKEPLTTIEGDCEYMQSYSSTGSDNLSANWTATLDPEIPHTKFGGDAKFKVYGVTQTIDSTTTPLTDQVIDVDLMLAEEPFEFGVTPGYFLYQCDAGGVEVCQAQLVNVQEAIRRVIAAGSGATIDFSSATFLGIYIKGMNPSVDAIKKRQNYKQEVCGFFEIPEPVSLETTSN